MFTRVNYLTKDFILGKLLRPIMGSAKSVMRSTSRDDSGGDSSGPSKNNDEITTEVCEVSDMNNGEMREFQIGSNTEKILLVKENDKFTALGTKCSHYGAPLAKGTLANGQIVCPWHGACFNSSTGDIEDYPGLDSLPKYKVDINDGKLSVTAKKSDMKSNKRQRNHQKKSNSDDRTFLVIGGGGAAASCIEELRYQGFSGRIIMATQESYLPYDRPKLSKMLDASGKKLALRSDEFYKNLDIEVNLNKKAINVDPNKKEVTFNNKEKIKYDKLVLATGGCPKKHPSVGNEIKNVCYLRSPDDANYIVEQGKGKAIAIIGNSFISMEVAAYFAEKASSVYIIAKNSVPFLKAFGQEVGLRLKKMFEAKENIKFMDEKCVDEFIASDGVLSSLKFDDGSTLDVDLCIIGIGVVPSTNYLKDSGIILNDSNQIIVNKFLQTNFSDIHAAGDIVEFPLPLFNCEVNIGHWQLAKYHGKIAACNMLNKEMEVDTVPFFWCMLFGKSIRFSGYNLGFNEVIIDGDLEKLEFAAYYIKDELVVAVASMNMGTVSSDFAALLKSGKKLTKDQIKDDPKCWLKNLS